MPTTSGCLNCGTPLPDRTGAPGRPQEYCGKPCRQDAYRKRRGTATAPASAAADDTAARELAHDLLEEARHLLRLLDRPDAPLLDSVEQSVTISRAADSLTAALVGRARRGRVPWARLGSALAMQPDTARRAYRTQTTSSAASTSPSQNAAMAPAWQAAPTQPEFTRQSRSHLAPVLSRLQRASRLPLRTLADRMGVSTSQISRILSGERFPNWNLTERFAHICGADPMVLRKVWEDEKLRDDQPLRPPRQIREPKAQLQIALRTLYIKAGRPSPKSLAEATHHTLLPRDVTASLAGCPATWARLADLVQTLGGDPSYFHPLWQATQAPSTDRRTTLGGVMIRGRPDA